MDFEIAQKVRLKKSLLKQPRSFPSNDAYATQSCDVAMATVVNASLLLSIIKIMACMGRTQFPFNRSMLLMETPYELKVSISQHLIYL